MATKLFLTSFAATILFAHCGIILDFDRPLPPFLAENKYLPSVLETSQYSTTPLTPQNVMKNLSFTVPENPSQFYFDWHSPIQISLLTFMSILTVIMIIYILIKVYRCKKVKVIVPKKSVSQSSSQKPPTNVPQSSNNGQKTPTSESVFSLTDVSDGVSTVRIRKTSSSVV